MDEHANDELMSIGEVATRTGLSVKLIRHWTDLGLLDPAERTAAGYRRYDPTALARLDLARTLRELGLGLDDIRAVLTRQRSLAEVARTHADAVLRQSQTLRLQSAVLRSAAERGDAEQKIGVLTRLARLSAAERSALIEDFLNSTLRGIDPPPYRQGLLAALPELPTEPTTAQVDAWLELGELLHDPELGDAMRRMATYAAAHSPAVPNTVDATAAAEVTDAWVELVTAAIAEGMAPDSPAADTVVAGIVAVWLPSQSGTAVHAVGDGEAARARLLEQLELAASAKVERYWQLVCTINGWPVRPSLAAPGRWLITALRTNPRPGARAEALDRILAEEPTMTPESILDGCDHALEVVAGLISRIQAHQLSDPTPCDGWDVRTLINHLVYENLMWTSLALGAPRSDHDADHLGGDPAAAFHAAAAATRTALHRSGLLHEQFGPAPGWRIAEQILIEMLVHGWDLARATGQSTDLLPEVATVLLPSVRAIYGELPRTPGSSFAPRVAPSADATAADRLAAFLGRAT